MQSSGLEIVAGLTRPLNCICDAAHGKERICNKMLFNEMDENIHEKLQNITGNHDLFLLISN